MWKVWNVKAMNSRRGEAWKAGIGEAGMVGIGV